MNQLNIGTFIAQRRRDAGLTQMQLAEKLGITDRAVSKWERGKALPDASLMLPLCELLHITVNDLLNGEVVSMENYNKEMERKLLETIQEKQQADKRLLTMELVIGFLCIAIFFALIIIASYVNMEAWLRTVLILIGFLPVLIATPFMLRIEQVAGYYQCGACGHLYVPTYKAVFMAPHMGRSRYMKCPECGKRSYHKKVLNKE